ncbi:MAG: hypothetical protein OXG85_14490 [Chloroflexi bacterium]|nr:hypothetical protein [Chloroflexota bacterium]
MASLLLVVLLAAALRLGRSDVVEYFHDDAMLATLALELADGQRFPLTGILSSTGIPNSPVSVYFLALPFALFSDPAVVIHFVMIWNALGVALLWLLARWHCGWRIALFAGLAYAVNPWAVLFSRKIWAQELHTPIIILGLLLLLKGFWELRDSGRRARSVAVSQSLGLPILLFGLQFHFAAWPLALLIPVSFWLGRRRLHIGAVLAAVALSTAVCAPYALGLAQTLESDPARISDAMARSVGSRPQFSSASLSATLRLAAGAGLEYWLAPDQVADITAGFTPLLPLAFALIPLIALGIGAAIAQMRSFAWLILIWAFLPSLLLIVEWTPVYIHYFIPSIPALALLVGIGLDRVLRLAARSYALQTLVCLSFALILALQIQAWHAALGYVDRRHVNYPGFTTPLSKLLPLRDALSAVDDVVVLAPGMAWNLHHEVAVWDTLLWDSAKCARTIVPAGYAVFPNQAFAALMAPGAPQGRLTDLYRNESAKSFPTREGGREYTLYRWSAAPAWHDSSIHPIAPQRFANGIRLTGYRWQDDQIALEWLLPARQTGEDLQYSAQAYAADGTRLAQLDARFWHGRHWCEGDRLLTFGPLVQQESARSLTIALYKLRKGKEAEGYINVELLDEMDRPTRQSVAIRIAAGNG